MPRFNCTIEFTLRTEIEPEGVYFDSYGVDGVSEFEEDSSWYAADVTSDGGRLTCVIEADSEDEASEKAAEILNEGSEVEDRSGITWMVDDVNVTIEEIEEPMTLDRAREIIRVWLDGREQEDELTEALDFLLAEFTRLANEIVTLRGTLRDTEAKLARIAGELDRLQSGPDGSEAPTEAVGEPA